MKTILEAVAEKISKSGENKKNWFARYYNWIYNGFPNDVCTFFWGTLFAILCSLLFIPGRLSYFGKPEWDYSGENSLGRGFVIIIVYFLALMGGVSVMYKFGYEPLGLLGNWILAPIIGLITFILFIVIIVGPIVGGVYYIENRKKSYSTPGKDWWGAIRGKYCTKITWK